MNVIFDMDGVIFDSERAYIDLYKKLAPKYGLDDVEAVHRACMDSIGVTRKKTKEIFFSYVGFEFDYDRYREDVQEELNKREFELKPGVYALFEWLRAQRIPVALGSSTRRVSVSRMLDSAGLKPYFDAIVCGDMVSHSKPHPEIFLTAAEKLGAVPADCYVIEDSYNGVRAAHAAGMHPIMVPDILQPDDEIRELAEVVLPSLIEVRDYLEEKNEA
ncbi:MAG: HAD family phosphatase [Ruminococcus sp.]|nr:HAD family phosphatase [Ruminococcus sp.]